MFQAAHNCDFYITKYHAKPMAQLQSLFSNISSGLKWLEEEETSNKGAEQPVDAAKERARKTTLKIANAANRSSWCSCCEMASFIKTGAMARKTHRPIAIFLSRPNYLYEECRRLLQSSPEMLIEPQVPGDDYSRHVDVLCFTKADTCDAAGRSEDPGDEPDTHSAAQPDVDNEKNDAISSSEEENLFNDNGDSEHSDADHPEPDSAALPAESPGIQIDHDGDALLAENIDGAVGPGEDAEPLEESLDITALEATTSAHDDWLHRGPFLFDMDFHTYVRFTIRRPLARDHKVADVKSEVS